MSWTDLTQLSNLVAWYKSESLSASYADTDPIDSWSDSSGNSRDLTGTTTTRPLAAANSINGYMAASFDGSDDILSSGSYTVGGRTYAAMVLNYSFNSNYNGLVCIDGNAAPVSVCDFLTSYGFGSGKFAVGRGEPTGGAVTVYAAAKPGVPVPATDTIVVLSASEDGLLLRSNGVTSSAADGSVSFATHTGTAYIHVGNTGLASSTVDGDIAEVAIWEDSVDTSVPWIEGYLAHKYGITLPSGHLFKNDPPSSPPPGYNSTPGTTKHPLARF